MTMTMQYRDADDRPRTLSFAQFVYLDTAESKGGFDCGWGGLDNTRTVRLLEERGLLQLRRGYGRQRWRVTGLTHLGREVLEEWKERKRDEP